MAAVFVSHKESDSTIAKACVEFILASLKIGTEDIFCTSVPGHQLKYGITIESQIRDGVTEQQVLFAILTRESIQSSWVLFELGAAWAMKRLLIPLVGPGLGYKDLPGSLSQYPCISIEEQHSHVRARIDDALSQASVRLGVKRKAGSKQVAAVDDLITSLSNWKSNDETQQNARTSPVPNGYELFHSDQGSSVFKSLGGAPFHCLCPTCYGKEEKRVVLQGDLNQSTRLFCPACKTSYRLKKDAPIQYQPRASEWSTRNW